MIEENSGPAKSVPLSEVSHLVSIPLSEVLLYLIASHTWHLQRERDSWPSWDETNQNLADFFITPYWWSCHLILLMRFNHWSIHNQRGRATIPENIQKVGCNARFQWLSSAARSHVYFRLMSELLPVCWYRAKVSMRALLFNPKACIAVLA